MIYGISIETIEAEAIMYLAIYYRDNNDYDTATMYEYFADVIFDSTFIDL
jgi:hypothetical protein